MQIEIPWNELHQTEEGTLLYFNTSEPHAENIVVEGFSGSDAGVVELTNAPVRSSRRPAAVAIVFGPDADPCSFEIEADRGYRVFNIRLGFIRAKGSIRPVSAIYGPRLLAPYEIDG